MKKVSFLILFFLSSPVFANSEITVDGQTAAGHVIYDESTKIKQREGMSFAGSGVSVADSGGKTVVTISDSAPINATYITQTSNSTLTNEQALASLSTGILKNTTTTGVVSIAVAGTDYQSPITPAALTKTDDTNVTLALGGTPTTALLQATSITAGWTGTLAAARLNSSVVQSIVNDTNVTGSIAAQALTLGWTGQLAISRGGTGQSTATAAFDALSPMTTLGDIIYGGTSGTGTRLAGNTTTTKKFLRQTGDGAASAAPAWDTLVDGDIPDTLTISTISNLTTNGFVKTGGGTGALSIDTSTYLTSATGVSSITGTANQVIASASVGAVTLSTPQDIATTSTPQFARLGLGQVADATRLLISSDAQIATLYGSAASDGDLTLYSTSNATKGNIFFGTSTYDEVNNRLGIRTASPSYSLHIVGATNEARAVNSTLTSNANGCAAIYGTLSDTTVTADGGFSRAGIVADYTAIPATASNRDGHGLLGIARTAVGGSVNTGTIYGLRFTAQNRGTATATGLIGTYAYPYSDSTGTTTTASGFKTSLWIIGGGTFTTWNGMLFDTQSVSGTITNLRGIQMQDYTQGTNNTLIGVGTLTTGDWGLYINSTKNNYLAGILGIGVSPTSKLHLGGNETKSAPTTTGAWLGVNAATLTDSSTAASGTVATGTFVAFAQPTYAASNTSVTVTDAANLYIANAPAAGTNTTLTNSWAEWIDAGNVRWDGFMGVYNGITTVSNGVPSELATIDSTGLTDNVAASTLYAVPASGAGMYRVSAYVVLTTAASVSSTLPNVQIIYTDVDSNTSVTIDATPVLGVAGTGQTGALTANTVGTVDAGVIPIYVKASTTIQYKTVNYASTAAGMTYALHIKLEAL